MKILVIEDNNVMRETIKHTMEQEGFQVFATPKAKEGLDIIEEESPNLIILDIILPDLNGFDVCKKIRKSPEIFGNPFILMLTAKNEKKDVLSGFEMGADDYIKKPFETEELAWRVKALLRRNSSMFSKIYKYENVLMDTEKNVVTENNEEVKLSKKEFDLLQFFIVNKNITLSREKIYENVWGDIFFSENRTVDVYVFKLKEKMPILKEKLTTIKGFGYRLE